MLYAVPLIWFAVSQAPSPPPAPPAKRAAESSPLPRVAPAGPLIPPKVRHALILCGHPGDAEHVKSFAETVRKLGEGLTKTVGIPPERQYILFDADRPKD